MRNSTDSFAETTDMWSLNDVLSDTLRSMRIGGSVLLNEEYAAPWGVAIPDFSRMGELLTVRKGVRAVAFHLVERGYCEIGPKEGGRVVLEAGEMAICFGGTAHWILQGAHPDIVAVEDILAGAGNRFRPGVKNQAGSTRLVCGVFLLHDTSLNPLFASLPPLLHVSASRTSSFNNLSGVAQLMAGEIERKTPGSSYVVERLLEVFCAEAIRAHLETAEPQDASWFNGIKDPIVGRAVAMLHAQPGVNWSVGRLAQGVAMSPSRFAARFATALGDSPMAYLAKWRMNMAGRLLDSTQQSVHQIATDVGYENLAAFNRAFKKHMGVPPAAWRHNDRNIAPPIRQ